MSRNTTDWTISGAIAVCLIALVLVLSLAG